MMWSNVLLFCLVFIWASGEPEPHVNVNINVNVNGESEESPESGISCNLAWNHEEYRPLIMLRENKEIIPPILDTRISGNPNRIPEGVKLIFACSGHDNIFNNVNGSHTKLHGECIYEDKIKVCVNDFPEIMELGELSCSRQMFPSFIKQENATPDEKSCDGQGGVLYKTGYTYGDYHEFKDLDIEVCFSERNKTSLCTSPNLNGNETDYRTSELQGKDTRMLQNPKPKKCKGCGKPKDDCEAIGKERKTNFKCIQNKQEDVKRCKDKKNYGGTWNAGGTYVFDTFIPYCENKACGCCVEKNDNGCFPPSQQFTNKHVCDDCINEKDGAKGALQFIKGNEDRKAGSDIGNGKILTTSTVFSKKDGIEYKVDGTDCKIEKPVLTWVCHTKKTGAIYEWDKCIKKPNKCTGKYQNDAVAHFDFRTLNCEKVQ